MEQPKTRLTYASKDDKWLTRLFIEGLELATGRSKLEKIYHEVNQPNLEAEVLWRSFIEKLNISLEYETPQLKKIPKEGPVIFISNHPFGVVDGLIIGHLASLVRKRFFILVNGVLYQDNAVQQYLLPIHFEETREAMRTNIASKNEALKRLKEGEIGIIFPGGGVSTAPKIIDKVTDFEWKRFVVKMIHKSKATVIPMFFHGQNSVLFQLASHINLNYRLGLLLNEVRNKMGKTIKINIGNPIAYETMAQIKDRQELLNHLRQVVYDLED